MQAHTRARALVVTTGLALGIALAALPGARADSVVVNGRELRGEIVSETSEAVVFKTGAGTMTIPRHAITKLVREDDATTLLAEARALARNGDRAALGVFDRAIEALGHKGDTNTAAVASAERGSLAARLGVIVGSGSSGSSPRSRSARRSSRPKAATEGDDLFLLKADAELAKGSPTGAAARKAASALAAAGQRHLANGEPRWAVGCFHLAASLDPQNVAFARAEILARRKACGRALQGGEAGVAEAALRPLLETEEGGNATGDVELHYLAGRVHEITDDPDKASAAYRRGLQAREIPNVAALAPDLLAELVRAVLRGKPVDANSPGVASGWTRVATTGFVIYHRLDPSSVSDHLSQLDATRRDVLARLSLEESSVSGAGPQLVFLYESHDSFVGSGAVDWAAGHAYGSDFIDGPHWTIASYPGRGEMDTIRHEIAHACLGVALPGKNPPPWAAEGAAMSVESDRHRSIRQTELSRAYGAGTVGPLADFLKATASYGDSRSDVSLFYARACVVFGVLADAAGGPLAALEVSPEIRENPETGLAGLGLTVDSLEAKVKAVLQAQPQDK